MGVGGKRHAPATLPLKKRPGTDYTWSDSKVMRLVSKKSFILFIHQLQCDHLQSTSLVPAHTFSSGAAILCSIPGRHLVGCCLRPALQTSVCLLLTQNGVFSLPILLFEIKRSRKVRDQVNKGCNLTVMHLDVKNRAQPRIPLLLGEIPGYHLVTNFSHTQFFSQYQTNGFRVHVHFISNHSEC